MTTPSLAVIGQPMFGSFWLAGLAVAAAIAVLLFAVAAAGRWLAATHPEATPKPESLPVAETEISPETLAIIACAVNATIGPRAQISAVSLLPAHAPSIEVLMQQWSLEGRRQIYTSHKVR
jgi:hypothetical protein